MTEYSKAVRRPPVSITRRGALQGAGAAGFAAAFAAPPAGAQTPPSLADMTDGRPFSLDEIVDFAREMSRRPYVQPPNDLPEVWASLPRERYSTIRANPGAFLFRGEDRGVMIEPLHRGFVFTRPVRLFVVEDGKMRRLPYDPAAFDFARMPPPPPGVDLAFSGLRLFGDAVDGQTREVAVIQGGTFFRAIARAQTYGVMARALALRLADARGEETPFFRAIWIERPSIGATSVNMHALVDSESASGVFSAVVRPGDVTMIDCQLTLFARQSLDNIGVGVMSGMYLFSPNERRAIDDIRPAVHEVSGLEIARGNGEVVWRPLANPQNLQISIFADENPRGFGLLQRPRDYAWFQDDEQRFERRPSLWIEPIGDWGPGAVQLVEIPSDAEVNKNIVAYWRPRAPLAAGGEAHYSFRQFWWWWPPERARLATVTQTRTGRGSGGRRRRFVVDFAGDLLGDTRAMLEMSAVVTASPGTIVNQRVLPYPEQKACRVSFELDPGADNLCELRLALTAAGQPLAETWLYRWTP